MFCFYFIFIIFQSLNIKNKKIYIIKKIEEKDFFVDHILTIKISFLAQMNYFEDGVFNRNDSDL